MRQGNNKLRRVTTRGSVLLLLLANEINLAKDGEAVGRDVRASFGSRELETRHGREATSEDTGEEVEALSLAEMVRFAVTNTLGPPLGLGLFALVVRVIHLLLGLDDFDPRLDDQLTCLLLEVGEAR